MSREVPIPQKSDVSIETVEVESEGGKNSAEDEGGANSQKSDDSIETVEVENEDAA